MFTNHYFHLHTRKRELFVSTLTFGTKFSPPTASNDRQLAFLMGYHRATLFASLQIAISIFHEHFIFIFCWRNYSPHVFDYLLLLITVLCFHPLPEVFKCCVLLKSARNGTSTENKRLFLSHKRPQTRSYIIDWHLQCWNANLVFEQQWVSVSAWSFAPWLREQLYLFSWHSHKR